MKKNTCIFCNSTTKRLKYNLPTFHHFGFKTISKKVVFRQCLNCLVIFNTKKIRNEYFEGKKYFTNEEKDHILEKRNKVTITRASELAKILKKELKNKSNLKILETGCNEGLLLTKLNKKINNGFFYGLDENRYNKKNFPAKINFHFLDSPDIEKIKKETFHLIILSHVFNYFNEPRKILFELKNSLKLNGQLFVVVPDIKKNPFYSLMGDQKLILSHKSIINILNLSGFKTKIIEDTTPPAPKINIFLFFTL